MHKFRLNFHKFRPNPTKFAQIQPNLLADAAASPAPMATISWFKPVLANSSLCQKFY